MDCRNPYCSLREIVLFLCIIQLVILSLIFGYYFRPVIEIYENDHGQWTFLLINVLLKAVMILIYFLLFLGSWKKYNKLLFFVILADVVCYIFRVYLLVSDLFKGKPDDALFNGGQLLFELFVIVILCWYTKVLYNEAVANDQDVELTERRQFLDKSKGKNL